MFELPITLLFVITISASSIINLLAGIYSKKFEMTKPMLWKFNLLRNLFCTIMIALIYIVSGTEFVFSWFSVILGVCLAAANIVSMLTTLVAQSCGPFAYTIVITALSAIIPTMSGVVLYTEPVKPIQWLGVLTMVICIILSPDTGKGKQNANKKWLIYCALAFVFSGSVGVIQKIHQHSEIHKTEMPALLLTGFAISTAFSLIMYLRYSNRDSRQKSVLFDKTCIYPIINGLCFAFPHTINLFLSGKVPAVIFFPVVNLSPMIINMVAAFFIFREKLSVKRWIGVAVGILSTVLVSGIISI